MVGPVAIDKMNNISYMLGKKAGRLISMYEAIINNYNSSEISIVIIKNLIKTEKEFISELRIIDEGEISNIIKKFEDDVNDISDKVESLLKHL